MPIRMLKARTAAAAQTSPRDLGGSKILIANIARNPLKRLISDERIQGNPSFSKP